MDDLLRQLELQIKKLLSEQSKLQQTNTELHHMTNKLAQEKKTLLTKQGKAITQIKSLVSKLKAIERLP